MKILQTEKEREIETEKARELEQGEGKKMALRKKSATKLI